jgi:hypothetical protein
VGKKKINSGECKFIGYNIVESHAVPITCPKISLDTVWVLDMLKTLWFAQHWA